MDSQTAYVQFAQELIDFIDESPTAFHAVVAVKLRLQHAGFCELSESDTWQLKPGGKYFVTKNQSAIIAFALGCQTAEESGFRIVTAHTDSPSFRIKPAPEIKSEGKYIKLNTEIYGGPILNTWFDRPLSVAGRIALQSDNPLYPVSKLVNITRPLLIIPNLAIHMNRDINKGVEINAQKDTLPLLGMIEETLTKDNYLLSLVAAELQVEVSEIIDFDLFLYETGKGSIAGLHDEFISCGRLDDLAMVHAGLCALTKTPQSAGTKVLAAFDNEEVGSRTKQGGDSEFLAGVLERIVLAGGGRREEYLRSLAKSFLISADLAHAVHPNYGDKHDPVNRPLLNHGPVIKYSANQSYTSDSDSACVYEEICRQANVPVQRFVNRSDLRGGSTIGPISSSHLPIRSVDIGSPILAMHSIRELAGVLDHTYVTKSFKVFYQI